MDIFVRFLSVSSGLLVPDVGPTGVIPATTPLVQLNVVPAVRLAGFKLTTVLLQISGIVRGSDSTGVGFTIIVNVPEGPGQSIEPLLNEGDTVIVADIGEVPAFVAVNNRLPVPSVSRPIAVLLLVQEKVVNPTVFAVVKITFCGDPLQITISAGSFSCPSGFTVMLNVREGPGQLVPPFVKMGVTVTVPVIGWLVVFAAVKDIFPLPDAGSPMPVLLFVQLYVVVPPSFNVVKETATVLFSQTILLTGCSTCPFGLTVMVKVMGGPGQMVGPFVNVGVMVIVAEMGDVPGLVAVNDGRFPLPDA